MKRARVPRSWKMIGVLLLLALAAAVPFYATDIRLFQLTNVLIYAIALLGLNILVGYNGQISLGHGAFYAIGAYVGAVLIVHAGVPHWLAVPLAGLACLGAGFLFGLPAVRLERVYLALLTFCFGAILPQVAKFKGIEQWTGGSQGMTLAGLSAPFGASISFDQWLYWLTLGVLVVLFIAAYNLLGGRIGRAIIAIRDHRVAAQAMGINTTRYQALVFGVSAMYTGVAGALAALSIQYVAPDLFNLFLSFGFLIGSAVGGIASLSGAIYGAIFLQAILFVVAATARSLQTGHVYAIYGIVLILFLYFAPGGIAGLLDEVGRRLRVHRDSPVAGAAQTKMHAR